MLPNLEVIQFFKVPQNRNLGDIKCELIAHNLHLEFLINERTHFMLVRLSQSVGQGGFNIRNDVILVQKLLNKQAIPGAAVALKEDGVVGKKTITRIELFQKHIVKMIRADGRIDPHGKSFKLLCEVKASAPQPGSGSCKILNS